VFLSRSRQRARFVFSHFGQFVWANFFLPLYRAAYKEQLFVVCLPQLLISLDFFDFFDFVEFFNNTELLALRWRSDCGYRTWRRHYGDSKSRSTNAIELSLMTIL